MNKVDRPATPPPHCSIPHNLKNHLISLSLIINKPSAKAKFTIFAKTPSMDQVAYLGKSPHCSIPRGIVTAVDVETSSLHTQSGSVALPPAMHAKGSPSPRAASRSPSKHVRVQEVETRSKVEDDDWETSEADEPKL